MKVGELKIDVNVVGAELFREKLLALSTTATKARDAMQEFMDACEAFSVQEDTRTPIEKIFDEGQEKIDAIVVEAERQLDVLLWVTDFRLTNLGRKTEEELDRMVFSLRTSYEMNRVADAIEALRAALAKCAVVPDALVKDPDTMASQQFVDGWNACRDATLAAQERQ